MPPLPTPFPIPTPGPGVPPIDLTPFWDVGNLGAIFSTIQTMFILANTYHLLEIVFGLMIVLVVYQWLLQFVRSRESDI